MFRHITWPLLRPTSFFVLVVSTVAAVSGAQAFDLIYVMTQGGPANATSLGMFYIYQQAFQFNNYGYASAMSATVVLRSEERRGGREGSARVMCEDAQRVAAGV